MFTEEPIDSNRPTQFSRPRNIRLIKDLLLWRILLIKIMKILEVILVIKLVIKWMKLMKKMMFKVNFTDAQCGFKALNRKAVDHLIPLVKDDEWFMDTELLLLAQKHKYRIADIPIRWIDDPNSSVNIFSTALKDIQGLFRMRKEFQMHLSNQKK